MYVYLYAIKDQIQNIQIYILPSTQQLYVVFDSIEYN